MSPVNKAAVYQTIPLLREANADFQERLFAALDHDDAPLRHMHVKSIGDASRMQLVRIFNAAGRQKGITNGLVRYFGVKKETVWTWRKRYFPDGVSETPEREIVS